MRREHARALASIEKGLRCRNLAPAYSRVIFTTFRRFLTTAPRRALDRLGRADVERFLATLVAAGNTTNPARELSTLNSAFRCLLADEIIAASPTEGMKVPRKRPSQPLSLSEAAVARLLAVALDGSHYGRQRAALALRDVALLELLYSGGLRVAEARAARVLDLDLEGGSLLVRSVKRGAWRRVPFTPRALAYLTRYLHEARPALLRRRPDPGHLLVTRRGTPLSAPHAFEIVRDTATHAGLRAHPHALRRAVATHLVRAGAALPAVQALLGHKQLSTTALYVTVDRDDLRRTVALLDPHSRDQPRAATPTT